MKKFNSGDLVHVQLPDNEDIRHNKVGKIVGTPHYSVVYNVLINNDNTKLHRCFLRKVSKETDPELFI